MANHSDWQERNLEQVSGIFRSPREVDMILNELDQVGFRSDVNVLMTDRTRDLYNSYSSGNDFSVDEQSKAPEGTTTGGLTGAALGAIIGGLTMVGSVVIPGAGLLVAGPIVGALTGGALGTAAGALIGALIGAGIPEHEAKFYEKALQEEGNALVVAHVPKSQAHEIRDLFNRCGAEKVRIS